MPDTLVRNLDRTTQQRFRRAAAARGIVQAEYMARLCELYLLAVQHPDWPASRLLAQTGLDPITV